MHVGGDLGQGVVGGADFAQQLDARTFQRQIGVAVGQGHFAPVHDALHRHPAAVGMDQVADEVGIINAIHADLDATGPTGFGLPSPDHGIDLVMDVALRMIGMPGLPLGEFGDQIERLEVAIDVVHVALELPGIYLVGAPRIGGGPVFHHVATYLAGLVKLGPIHEEILQPRRNRTAVMMDNVGKLDARDVALMHRPGVQKQVAGGAAMAIPFHFAWIGMSHILLTGAIGVEHLEQHFEIHIHAPVHLKVKPPPAQDE